MKKEKVKVKYVYYSNDRDGVSDIEKGEMLVDKFDFKSCWYEYYKDDKWSEFCEEGYDVYMNESKDVMVVCDNGECYDNFVFMKV